MEPQELLVAVRNSLGTETVRYDVYTFKGHPNLRMLYFFKLAAQLELKLEIVCQSFKLRGQQFSEAMAEGKQKLQFIINGKTFAYEGFPKKRERDFFDLIAKMKVPTGQMCDAFRYNFPEMGGYDNAAIEEMFEAAKEAKARAKAEKKAAAAAQQQESPAPPPPELPAPVPTVSPRRQPVQSEQVVFPSSISQQARHFTEHLTPEARADLDSFIEQVVSQPPEDIAAKIRRTGAQQPPPVSPRKEASQGDYPQHPRTVSNDIPPEPSAGDIAAERTMDVSGVQSRDKVAIYINMEGTTSNKLVCVERSVAFSDFIKQVDKKFGRPVALRFVDDDDIIEVDDDDCLRMFLDRELQPGQKLKMTCLPSENRRRANDDQFTSHENTKGGGEGGDAPPGDGSLRATESGLPPPATGAGLFAGTSTTEHRELRTYTGHNSAVYCCAFSPAGDRFISAGRDRTVRLWNVADGENKAMRGGHNGFVLSCDCSPNGVHVVSSSDDTTIKLWDSVTLNKIYTMKEHKDKVYCTKFNSTGAYIVSASCDKTVKVWSADTGSKQSTLKGHTLAVFACGFSNADCGKYVVSASDDRQVKIWDWREGKEVRSLIGHTGTVWSSRFSHNDKYVVSASMDHEIKIWDVASGLPIRSITGHMTPIHDAMFTQNDKYIASCARDWTVMIWDAQQGTYVDTLPGHRHTVYHMDMCQDKLLTCSMDETVKLWSFPWNTNAVSP